MLGLLGALGLGVWLWVFRVRSSVLEVLSRFGVQCLGFRVQQRILPIYRRPCNTGSHRIRL